jgi:hypothetical protein
VTTRFTPDGQGFAYVDASGRNVWTRSFKGGEPRQLTPFTDGRLVMALAYSRDGKRLAVGPRDDDQRHRPVEGIEQVGSG